jgi:hypothetical protein
MRRGATGERHKISGPGTCRTVCVGLWNDGGGRLRNVKDNRRRALSGLTQSLQPGPVTKYFWVREGRPTGLCILCVLCTKWTHMSVCPFVTPHATREPLD